MSNSRRPKKIRRRSAYHHGDLRRALVDAAVGLLAETQEWHFSLREVARRAQVSHNAPYSHFTDKGELLAAVASAGFHTLRSRMLTASQGAQSAADALAAIGYAYVRFGVDHAAHYRLMFGTTVRAFTSTSPPELLEAARASRAVLSDLIRRGAEDGVFNVSPHDEQALMAAALAAWSVVHGLTLLFIDGLATLDTPVELQWLLEQVSSTFMQGLVKPVEA